MKKVISIFAGKAKDFKGFKEEKKMTKADDMFRKLGFLKAERPQLKYTEYFNKNEKTKEMVAISFEGNSKTIMACLYTPDDLRARGLAMQPEELAAAYEKCKELGWLQDD